MVVGCLACIKCGKGFAVADWQMNDQSAASRPLREHLLECDPRTLARLVYGRFEEFSAAEVSDG